MSELSDAQAELQEAFDEALGEPQTVKIGGLPYPAIIGDLTYDEIVVAGGIGENGGFSASVAVLDCPEKPAQLAAIEARGNVQQILTVTGKNGVTWEMVCGDASVE